MLKLLEEGARTELRGLQLLCDDVVVLVGVVAGSGALVRPNCFSKV